MRKNMIAERIQRLLGGLKCEFLAEACRDPQRFSKTDAAVLKVAMMVAALDGNVTDAELKMFERLAKKCRGYTADAAKEVFRDGLKSAGYIELAARTLNGSDLQKAFADEAERILPRRCVFAAPSDIRRAFVMWLAMAMSDGDYSSNERKAISLFARFVASRDSAAREMAAVRVHGFSPTFVMAYGNSANAAPVLSRAFFAKVESLIAELDGETPAAAEKELKSLIVNGCSDD